MLTKYTIIYTDGRAVERFVELAEEPDLDAIKAIVRPAIASLTGDGPMSWDEHVTVFYDGERRDMFVDEHGIAKGLPRNDEATKIYRNNWLTQHPNVDPESLDFIRGDAVLFGRRVWF